MDPRQREVAEEATVGLEIRMGRSLASRRTARSAAVRAVRILSGVTPKPRRAVVVSVDPNTPIGCPSLYAPDFVASRPSPPAGDTTAQASAGSGGFGKGAEELKEALITKVEEAALAAGDAEENSGGSTPPPFRMTSLALPAAAHGKTLRTVRVNRPPRAARPSTVGRRGRAGSQGRRRMMGEALGRGGEEGEFGGR